jgi:hypothetical protein
MDFHCYDSSDDETAGTAQLGTFKTSSEIFSTKTVAGLESSPMFINAPLSPMSYNLPLKQSITYYQIGQTCCIAIALFPITKQKAAATLAAAA